MGGLARETNRQKRFGKFSKAFSSILLDVRNRLRTVSSSDVGDELEISSASGLLWLTLTVLVV